MPITFKTEKNIQEIQTHLKSVFPDFFIKKKNKTTIYVRNKKLLAVLKVNPRKQSVAVYGDLNMGNAVIIAWLIAGILLTFVVLAIIFIVLYSVNNKKIKDFREQIYESIAYE